MSLWACEHWHFLQLIQSKLELNSYFAHIGYIEIVAEDDMITSRLPGLEVVETSADTNLHMERNNITETTPDVINNHESSAPLRYWVIRERQKFKSHNVLFRQLFTFIGVMSTCVKGA